MIPGYMITNFCGIVLFSIGFQSEDQFLMIMGSLLTLVGILEMFFAR